MLGKLATLGVQHAEAVQRLADLTTVHGQAMNTIANMDRELQELREENRRLREALKAVEEDR